MVQMNALAEAEIQQRLASGALEAWTYQENALQRIHTCHLYLQSLELLYQVGQMAEQADHHPDLLLHYKRLTIRYWTHRAKGVTELDFECARKAEAIIQASTQR